LTSLLSLSCSYNQLTSFPDLSALISLRSLSCHGNQLTSFPDLSGLTNLLSLSCAENQLTSLPDLSTLTNLWYLNCYSNQLTSLPELPENLTSLKCWLNLLAEDSCPTLADYEVENYIQQVELYPELPTWPSTDLLYLVNIVNGTEGYLLNCGQ